MQLSIFNRTNNLSDNQKNFTKRSILVPMAQHVIPEGEEDEHVESSDCKCEPTFHVDKESGEMVWKHQIIDFERLFDDFIKT